MKIELIKNDKGTTVGWKLIAESVDDKLTLGSIRHIEFYGTGDDVIKYNGIKTEQVDKGEYVTEVHYCTKGHKQQLDEERRNKYKITISEI